MNTLLKPDWYYRHARREIATLLPQHIGRVLEIGCSNGATLTWLREQRGAKWVAGVEYVPDVAREAATHLDACWTGDVEGMEIPIEPASLDLLLCLDVLEHLRDPWAVLRRLAPLLRTGGTFVTSVPNARNMVLVKQLVIRGRFDYAPEGIMDETHLRWFTRRTAVEMVERAGLRVDHVEVPSRRAPRVRLKNLMTFGLLREFFDFQYLIRAVRQ
jgi:SAM-dependent methyltransferase